MLSQAQIESYRTEGYLIVENVFQSDEVGQALCIVDDFVEKSRQVTSQEGHFDLEPGHTAEHPKVRRMSSPVTYHSLFNQWMGDARVLDILTPLIALIVFFCVACAPGWELIKVFRSTVYWRRTILP